MTSKRRILAEGNFIKQLMKCFLKMAAIVMVITLLLSLLFYVSVSLRSIVKKKKKQVSKLAS